MTQCKQVYELLNKNMNVLKACGKDDTMVSRIHRHADFCKRHGIAEPWLIPEGTLRAIEVKEAKGDDVKAELQKIKAELDKQAKIRKDSLAKAEDLVNGLETIAQSNSLTKTDKKRLEKAKKSIATNKPTLSKAERQEINDSKNRIRDIIRNASGNSLPNGRSLTLKEVKEKVETERDRTSKLARTEKDAQKREYYNAQVYAFNWVLKLIQ